jgi:hypothetical protein
VRDDLEADEGLGHRLKVMHGLATLGFAVFDERAECAVNLDGKAC